MASSKPPPFGKQEYWDDRFRENKEPYDWLQPASCLDKEITEALMLSDDLTPQILHIGGGTSLLSFHLRSHVEDPRQVQNADFSGEAIKWGLEREKEIFNFQLDEDDFEPPDDDQDPDEAEEQRRNAVYVGEIPTMRWSQTSLLSLPSVITTCQLGAFSVIVDKSCCDAIACGDNVDASLYFGLYCPSGKAPASSEGKGGDTSLAITETYRVHPLHVLGLNLALLARPAARWVALSYSENRFPFLHGKGYQPKTSRGEFDNSLPKELLEQGFPDPGKLWFQIRKQAVTADGEESKKGEDGVYRPEPRHWIYVLERTPVELKVR
jgi:hypothetical protein